MKHADQNVMLASLRQTLTDYRELKKSVAGLRDLELVVVRRARTDEDCSKALFEQVQGAINAQGESGWARFRSDLGWTGSGHGAGFSSFGEPIYAEWTIGTSASCRLRLNPSVPGKANIWTYTERVLAELDELAAEEVPFLREKACLLAHPSRLANHELRYSVYWGVGLGHGDFARVFDRFTGIVEMGS